MWRCLNCHLCIKNARKHAVSSLESTMQTLLITWRRLQQLPPDTAICRECFLLLSEHCRNGNTNAERELGHPHTCVGCGRSLSQLKKLVRYENIEMNHPLTDIILSWDTQNEVISGRGRVCYNCYRRAYRQLSHGASILKPGTDHHAEIEHQQVDPDQLETLQQAQLSPSREQHAPGPTLPNDGSIIDSRVKSEPVDHAEIEHQQFDPLEQQVDPDQLETLQQAQTSPSREQQAPTLPNDGSIIASRVKSEPDDHAEIEHQQVDPLEQQVDPLEQQVDPMIQQVDPMIQQVDPMIQQVDPMIQQVDPMIQQVDPMTQQVHAKPLVVLQVAQPSTLREQQAPALPNDGSIIVSRVKSEVDDHAEIEHQQVDPLEQQVDPMIQQVDPMIQQVDPMIQQVDPMTQQVDPMIQQVDPMTQQVDAKPLEVLQEAQPSPPREQQAPTSPDDGFIILPRYKRAVNTSSRCIFQDCASKSGHIIPLFIKVMLLKQYHIYAPVCSRVCKSHLNANQWAKLKDNRNLTSQFTAEQIQNLISILERNTELFDFENVHEMRNHLCHYWTGLSVLEFLTLYSKIPVLENIAKGKTYLAIYLTKLRTGDSNRRLAHLYNLPRSTLETYLKKMRNYFKNHYVPNNMGLQHINRIAQRRRRPKRLKPTDGHLQG